MIVLISESRWDGSPSSKSKRIFEMRSVPVVVVQGVKQVPAGPARSRVIDLSDINLDRLRDVVNGVQLELAEVTE